MIQQMEFAAAGETRRLNLEIANTPSTRVVGLSGREDLGESDGMLFAFDSPVFQPFTATSCRIRIHAQFFDSAGRKVDSFWMNPGERGPFWAKSVYQYVLETVDGTEYDSLVLS